MAAKRRSSLAPRETSTSTRLARPDNARRLQVCGRSSDRPLGGPLDADALARFGIDLDAVRRRVEEEFGAGALDRTRAVVEVVVEAASSDQV
jgi:hypothetical protein